MKCHSCDSPIYKHYTYCPKCGTVIRMCSKHYYAMNISSSQQANRIEDKLDTLLKHFGVIWKNEKTKKEKKQ